MRRIEPTSTPRAVRQVLEADQRQCVSCPTVKKFNQFLYEIPFWPVQPTLYACSKSCFESWRSSGKSAK